MNFYFLMINAFFLLITSAMTKECIYTYKTTPEESKYTKQFSIDTDRKGHSVRIFALENTYKNKINNCEGVSIVKSFNWGYSDYIDKSGPVKGHVTQIYSDGSKMFMTFEGTSQNPEDNSENFLNIGTVRIVGGTGIYENVKGYGKNKGEFNPDTGYSSFQTILKYTK